MYPILWIVARPFYGEVTFTRMVNACPPRDYRDHTYQVRTKLREQRVNRIIESRRVTLGAHLYGGNPTVWIYPLPK